MKATRSQAAPRAQIAPTVRTRRRFVPESELVPGQPLKLWIYGPKGEPPLEVDFDARGSRRLFKLKKAMGAASLGETLNTIVAEGLGV